MPSLLALLLQVERDKAISMVLEESKKKEKERKKESAPYLLESGTAAEEEISDATLKRLRKEAPEGRMLFLFALPSTFYLFFFLSYCCICVLILLYMCPYTAVYMCPHTTGRHTRAAPSTTSSNLI
jgi:hypothetical protein